VAKHSFFFEEAVWTADGEFTDALGRLFPLSGEARFTHGAVWSNDSVMRVAADPPWEIHNAYQVIPFEPSRLSTVWSSTQSSAGRFLGTLTVVDDVILSHGHTADSRHVTVEILRRVSDDQYENRGAYFVDGSLVSSWSVTLRRTPLYR